MLRAAGRPEIICLQEVAYGWAGLKGQPEPLDGTRLLGAAMPEYQVLSFSCLEQGNGAGGVRLGNLIMSRLPVGRVFRHLLPRAAGLFGAEHAAWLPRGRGGGQRRALRIPGTHLEYYSKEAATGQATRLAGLQQEAVEQARSAEAQRRPWRPSIFDLPARRSGGAVWRHELRTGQRRVSGDRWGRRRAPAAWCDAWTQCHPGGACATVGCTVPNGRTVPIAVTSFYLGVARRQLEGCPRSGRDRRLGPPAGAAGAAILSGAATQPGGFLFWARCRGQAHAASREDLGRVEQRNRSAQRGVEARSVAARCSRG